MSVATYLRVYLRFMHSSALLSVRIRVRVRVRVSSFGGSCRNLDVPEAILIALRLGEI